MKNKKAEEKLEEKDKKTSVLLPINKGLNIAKYTRQV